MTSLPMPVSTVVSGLRTQDSCKIAGCAGSPWLAKSQDFAGSQDSAGSQGPPVDEPARSLDLIDEQGSLQNRSRAAA